MSVAYRITRPFSRVSRHGNVRNGNFPSAKVSCFFPPPSGCHRVKFSDLFSFPCPRLFHFPVAHVCFSRFLPRKLRRFPFSFTFRRRHVGFHYILFNLFVSCVYRISSRVLLFHFLPRSSLQRFSSFSVVAELDFPVF